MGRSLSFSYLNLLPANGEFPHRTQPIGAPQTQSRRGSVTSQHAASNSSSQGSLLIRSNPIGLAEPSQKRDGYAVSKDGSMYRSTETLYQNPKQLHKQRSVSVSATPERDLARRRGSWTISHQGSFRMGSGIISAGDAKQKKDVILPFGGGGSKTVLSTAMSKTQHQKVVSQRKASITRKQQQQFSMSTTTTTTTILPQQNVTVSLPASRRISRNTSVERDFHTVSNRLKKSSRQGSVEVFEGAFVVKMKNDVQSRRGSIQSVTQKSGKTTHSTEEEAVASVDSGSGKVENKTAPVDPSQQAGETDLENFGPKEAGMALRELTVALEKLEKQQQTTKTSSKVSTSSSEKKSSRRSASQERGRAKERGSCTSIDLIVSRNGSQRSSRAQSPNSFRSRRNSMDLYSANCTVRLPSCEGSRRGSRASSEQRDICHIRCDDNTKNILHLCTRCHSAMHNTKDCTEFQDLCCPRCLSWDHWEDTCPNVDAVCTQCQVKGHTGKVHGASKFSQRRMIVDTLGWESFQDWFLESPFRSWWQLNGCTGVPLYKIYKRTTEWRLAPLERQESCDSLLDEVALTVESIKKSRAAANNKYSFETLDDKNEDEKENDENASSSSSSLAAEKSRSRLRTYSETLKSLDEDILKELNV